MGWLDRKKDNSSLNHNLLQPKKECRIQSENTQTMKPTKAQAYSNFKIRGCKSIASSESLFQLEIKA